MHKLHICQKESSSILAFSVCRIGSYRTYEPCISLIGYELGVDIKESVAPSKEQPILCNLSGINENLMDQIFMNHSSASREKLS
jgi:hypothetical protein